MSLFIKKMLLALMVLGLVGISATAFAQTDEEKKLAEQVRSRLIRLSEFRVFDWLSFRVEGSKVTLNGFASRPSLHRSAEVAISRIKGVEEVVNEIEILPNSPMDDDIRALAYAKIYTHPVLQRYAPGGGVTPSGFRDEAASIMHWGLDASMSMRGPHAVHIIVRNGHILLIGQLGSEMDKQIAETIVRTISGVFGVQNMIQVPE